MATKATATKAAPETERIVKAGGAKGTAIVELMTAHPEYTRTQIAEAAGATVGRVGEVVRYLATYGTAAERKAVQPFLAGPRTPKAEKPAKAAKATAAKKTAEPKAVKAVAAKRVPRGKGHSDQVVIEGSGVKRQRRLTAVK